VIKTAEVHDNAIARDVKETLRKLKAAQYVASAPERSLPGQVERRRQDPGPVAGPGRQDLKPRARSCRQPDRPSPGAQELSANASPPSLGCRKPFPGVKSLAPRENRMLDANIKTN
jgi:hypothetical protein